MLTELTVPTSAIGVRLDVWLTEALDGCTRSLVARLIKQGMCSINGPTGKVIKPKAGYFLDGGEVVALEVPDAEPMEAKAEDIPLTILHEDERYIIIDKPAGMVVHPAVGHLRGTLVNALLGRYGTRLASGEGWRPGIIHRLDAETSGVIAVARDDEALRFAQDAFKEREVKKLYLALVAGEPKTDFFESNGAIGRHARDFRKRAIRELGEGDAREAYTSFVVHSRGKGFSVIEARPRTGRTHQIRIHLAAHGHPILADVVYGRSRTWPVNPPVDWKKDSETDREGDQGVIPKVPVLSRQALHAWTLELPHPDGHTLSITAPIPADLHPWVAKDLVPKPR